MKNYFIESFIKGTNLRTAQIIDNMLEASLTLGFCRLTVISYSIDDSNASIFFEDTDISRLTPQDSVHLHLPTGMGAENDRKLISLLSGYNFKLCIYIHDFLNYPNYDFLKGCRVIAINNRQMLHIFKDGISSDTFISEISIRHDSSPIHVKSTILDILEACSSGNNDDYQDSTLIHVAFGLYDKTGHYYINTAAAILSILQHTNSKICFHIIHDDTLSNKATVTLKDIIRKHNSTVFFHNVDITKIKNFETVSQVFTVGSLFRLFIPQIFTKLSKIIYLDSDILFLRDIAMLWNIDIIDKTFAGVTDPAYKTTISGNKIINLLRNGNKNYINTGVLIFNIEKLRQGEDMVSRVSRFFNEFHDLYWPDQDAINYIYCDDIITIDDCWNRFTFNLFSCDDQVVHFAGKRHIDFTKASPADILLFKYYLQIPGGIDFIHEEYFRGLSSAYDKVNGLQKVINKLTHRNVKKIYYGPNTMAMKTIMDITLPADGDYIIGQDNNQNSLLPVKNISSLGEETKGSFIVFVLPEADNGTSLSVLESFGLKNSEDFFVIPCLLTANQGGYLL